MVKAKNMYIVALFMVVLITGVSIPYIKVKESLTGGKYPESVNNPLLADSYKVKKNPGYDAYSGASDIYINYPQFKTKHCGTNNIKYWRRPTNGQCTPAGFCMGLYDATEQKIPAKLNPPPIIPKIGETRVNFFESKY